LYRSNDEVNECILLSLRMITNNSHNAKLGKDISVRKISLALGIETGDRSGFTNLSSERQSSHIISKDLSVQTELRTER
jgi:hypothetical protein